mmetsp:Transcript_139734/g.257231  ORF Transcript_139734/g.257231 Transcript_139734/m.257231 type:complete len:249 (-) Transcript_139734:253-999(-)
MQECVAVFPSCVCVLEQDVLLSQERLQCDELHSNHAQTPDIQQPRHVKHAIVRLQDAVRELRRAVDGRVEDVTEAGVFTTGNHAVHVDELPSPRWEVHDVQRLEVAVDELLGVEHRHDLGELQEDAAHLFQRQRSPCSLSPAQEVVQRVLRELKDHAALARERRAQLTVRVLAEVDEPHEELAALRQGVEDVHHLRALGHFQPLRDEPACALSASLDLLPNILFGVQSLECFDLVSELLQEEGAALRV